MSKRFLEEIYFLTPDELKSRNSVSRLKLTGKEAYSFSYFRKVLLE
jgi:hypothetical protein